MSRIRFVWIALYLLLSIALVVFVMALFRSHNRSIRQAWAKVTLRVLGAKICMRGEMDPRAQMIIANHTSMIDIIVLEALHPHNLCWVAKEEIRKIPLYGHILTLPKMIWIKREDKKELLRLIQVAGERLLENRVLALFPEGTRNTTHPQTLKPFKGGARIIAEKYALAIQPVVIEGTIPLLNVKQKSAQGGELHITFLPLFTPEPKTAWLEKTREGMQEILKESSKNSLIA